MLQRITSRLTYSNTIATLALFIALGGSSYAATHLGRNSVGSAQIRTGAVGSSQVRNGSLRLADLSTSTRASLRGQTGPAGPQGPAGTPAVSYFAFVASDGGVVRGTAKGGSHTSIGSGIYAVTFPKNANACAATATLGTGDSTPPPLGLIGVSTSAQGDVVVQTSDPAGNPKDLPFHVILAC